jgi:hypothetical protein
MTTPALTYADLDPILSPWVARHRLHLYTDCKGEEVRIVTVVDDAGHTYHIYARPDASGKAAISADLVTRAGEHAFFRERRRFHHLQLVPLSALASGLDAALEQVQSWIVQSRHTRA